MQRVFISYSHVDAAYMKMVGDLVLSLLPDSPVFIDTKSLRGGDRWQQAIGDAIAASDVFVVLWSRRAADSEWVQRELDLALLRKRRDAALRILPVLVDGSALPHSLGEFQSVSLVLVGSPAVRRALWLIIGVAVLALALALLAYVRQSHRMLAALLIAALWTGITAFVGLRQNVAPWRARGSAAAVRLLFGTFEAPPLVASAMLWTSIVVAAMSATLSWLLRG